MNDRWMDRAMWALIVLGGAAIVVALGMGITECVHQSACESSGGHVEHYNQHTVMVPISCGSGCVVITPVEESDWRCVK